MKGRHFYEILYIYDFCTYLVDHINPSIYTINEYTFEYTISKTLLE